MSRWVQYEFFGVSLLEVTGFGIGPGSSFGGSKRSPIAKGKNCVNFNLNLQGRKLVYFDHTRKRAPLRNLSFSRRQSSNRSKMLLLGNHEWIKSAGCIFVAMMLSSVEVTAAHPEDCESRMLNCTEKVRPFLHDLEYMFPTNLEHIDNMCRLWSSFVDCIRLYVKDCANDEQRSRFNEAVGDSIDTVHAICSSDKYQKEYLQSASCFRKVSVDNCGAHYNDMVDEVSQFTNGASDNICCSYSKFRSCVSEPLLRLCGSRARTIMDHSMAFLIHRCSGNSYSLSYECPKPRGRSDLSDDQFVVVSSSNIGRPPLAPPDADTDNVRSSDGRHRPSSFRSESSPRDGEDFYDRHRPNSRQIETSAAAAATSYRSPNQYRFNEGPSNHYRSSPTFAASPTFTSSSSAASAFDEIPSGQNKVGERHTKRLQGSPTASASSRLLRNYQDDMSSAGNAPVAGGRVVTTANGLFALMLSLLLV